MKKNPLHLIMDVDLPDSAAACELLLINAAIQNCFFQFISHFVLLWLFLRLDVVQLCPC